MAVRLNIGDKDFSFTHGILSILGHVDGGLDGASQLELVGLDGDHADEWHLDDQLLGVLVVKAVSLDAPTSTF